MLVDRPSWAVVLISAILLVQIGGLKAQGKTLEIDVEDEGQSVTPTIENDKPLPTAIVVLTPGITTGPLQPTPTVQSQPTVHQESVTEPEQQTIKDSKNISASIRTRASDQITFYYFLRAGYVVDSNDRIPVVGKVSETYDAQSIISTGQKIYAEIGQKKGVKVGDLLIPYRLMVNNLKEPHSGFSGDWVKNLGIVKVLEVQRKYCLVESIKSFEPFQKGDSLRIYNDEIKRWKQAQTKKILPQHEIHCYVAGGESGRTQYAQYDFIVLTAGSKKGVVEGQTFEIRKAGARGVFDETIHALKGKAQVFYVGPSYSMAQIVSSVEPIEQGFEASYRP